MASTLPKIVVRTDADTIIKIKHIAEKNQKSVSKEVERLILKHIWEYEKEHGEIQISQMNTKEVIEDIGKRIAGFPPYGDEK